jgi:hypothetical protein
MKKELLEEIIKINHFYNRINEAINPVPAARMIKNLVKDMPEGAFKKLFSVFSQEEETAYKVLEKPNAKVAEIESAVEKLIQNINFSELAAHLLENKKLGTQIDNFIETKIKNIESGTISKEKALNDLESVLTSWSEKEGIPELGPELVKKLEGKFQNSMVPDFSGILKSESEEIFNLVGKKLSTTDAKLLNDVYGRLLKLKPEEIIKVENALKRITSQDGILQQSINRLKQAKDVSSKMKSENFQKALNKAIEYLNTASTTVGKLKVVSLIKGIATIFGLVLAYKAYTFFSNLMSQLQSIPYIGQYFSSDDTQTPEPTKTEPDKPEETW